MLCQAVTEWGMDIVIIANTYRASTSNRAVDRSGQMAAIWSTGKYPAQELVSTSYKGVVVGKVNEDFFCSVHAPSRWSIKQFMQMLDCVPTVLTWRRPAIKGGFKRFQTSAMPASGPRGGCLECFNGQHTRCNRSHRAISRNTGEDHPGALPRHNPSPRLSFVGSLGTAAGDEGKGY